MAFTCCSTGFDAVAAAIREPGFPTILNWPDRVRSTEAPPRSRPVCRQCGRGWSDEAPVTRDQSP
jgi:hypothetical protein